MPDQGKFYDLIASQFAEMRTSFYREKKYIDLFVGYLEPKGTLLDIGCGSGVPIASYLLDLGFDVTGIDSSNRAIALKLACEYRQSLTKMSEIQRVMPA
jgi:2-polyprenyl-3-methyl-5-hydroxy-6-metoxy-1,4-benzoquinol methylase